MEMDITRCSNCDGEMNCPRFFVDEHREILMNQVKMHTHNVQLGQMWIWRQRQRRLPLRPPSPTLIKSFAVRSVFNCTVCTVLYCNHLQRQKFVMKMKKKTFHNCWDMVTMYNIHFIDLSPPPLSLVQSICNAIGNFLFKYINLLCINLSNKWFICCTQNSAGERPCGNSLIRFSHIMQPKTIIHWWFLYFVPSPILDILSTVFANVELKLWVPLQWLSPMRAAMWIK